MDSDSKQKADEEWQENWAHLDSEGLARKFLEFLEDNARTALNFDRLTKDNRKTTENVLERLRPAFEKVAAIINKTAGPGYSGHGWGDLHRLMAWTWALGAKGDVPESAEPFLQSQRAKTLRPQNPIDEKIMEGLRKGRRRHSIANELKLPDNDAFKQRVSRVKKRMEKIS